MAIGSAPEYGVTFGTWGELSEAQRLEHWARMADEWGPDLMRGYATLVMVNREP